jgi:hypothetical protein
MERQSQIHFLIITFLIYDHFLLLLINLVMSLFILAMVCNWNREEHRIHTFRNNVYHLLLLIGRFLKTLSSSCEYLTCIFELFMYHIQIIYKILGFLMTIFHHVLDYIFMNIFELQHLLNGQTYYPFQQCQKNIINYRI